MCPPDEPSPAPEELVPLVYDELRAIAHSYFRRQPANFTLQPTEIVNEACLHLLQHGSGECANTGHFRAIATRKMWQVIVDHLKRRHAQKRGGDAPGEPAAGRTVRRRVPLETVAVEWRDRVVDLLDLADALDALAAESRRLRDVVMLHWFGGLKYAEVADALGLSASTVEKDFRYALAWLNRRLAAAGGAGAD
jgi:RNA polymerase sigma-70 factor, ECF subfamily